MKPTTLDLRRHVRDSVRAPRGEPFDPWGGQSFRISPVTLRVGVDRLRLVAGGYRVRRSNVGTYCGHWRDRVAILLDGERIPVLISALHMGEHRQLRSSVSWWEFCEGWYAGVDAWQSRWDISRQSEGRKPSDYSRGFVASWRMLESGNFRITEVEGYNETVRRLAHMYPAEHWVEPGERAA